MRVGSSALAGEADSGLRAIAHATAIAVAGRAALLLGASGTGKSDLALRCLMLAARDGERRLEARLVADDQVQLAVKDGRLLCRPPPTLVGLIEVRGIGIVPVSHVAEAEVVLAVRLDGPVAERLPEPGFATFLGCSVPEMRVQALEASAPFKVLLALARTA